MSPRRQRSVDPLDILRALNRGQVRYLVVGGVAVMYHGVPRGTFDIDLAVELEEANLERFERTVKRLGFVAKAPASITGLADPKRRRAWTQRKHMQVFSFQESRPPFRVVDVLVRPLRGFDRVYRTRVVVRDHGVAIPLAPVTTLIRLKTGTGRLRDAEDVEYLRFIQSRRRRGSKRP